MRSFYRRSLALVWSSLLSVAVPASCTVRRGRGGETYQTLLPRSFEVEAFTVHFKCIDLPTLIRIKEAVGRRKDLKAIAELQVLLEESAK